MIFPLKQALKDVRGIASVEFALIVPVLLILFTSVAEISNLMMVERRVSAAAHTTADLIAQETDLTNAELSQIFEAARHIMDPFDDSGLTLGAVSVRYDDTSGDPYEDWSSSYNGGNVFNSTTVADDLGNAGESVIIVTASFAYSPIFSMVLPSSFTLGETAITRPRYTTYVGVY